VPFRGHLPNKGYASSGAQPQIRERPAGKGRAFSTEAASAVLNDRSGMNNILVPAARVIGSHLVDHLLRPANGGLRLSMTLTIFMNPAIKSENVSSHLDNANYRLFRIDIRISRRWTSFCRN